MNTEEAARWLSALADGIKEAAVENPEGSKECDFKAQEEAVRMGLSAIREKQKREEEPQPLTLDELRQMDGQPVWVVFHDTTSGEDWGIVANHHKGVALVDSIAPFDGCGRTYTAYDRPPGGDRR